MDGPPAPRGGRFASFVAAGSGWQPRGFRSYMVNVREQEERRARILEVAERLFHHYGPLKTTVADIAREAGIGVGTVYLDFESKDGILQALSRRRYRIVLEAEKRAWVGRGRAGMRLRRALDARFEAFLELAGSGTHAADLFHCSACEPIRRAHTEFLVEEESLFRSFLEEGSTAGELAVRDATRAAKALLRAYACFSPPLIFQLQARALREDLSELHELVLRGISRR